MGARLRPDLRLRGDGAPRGRGLRLQRLGREVHALRRRRGVRRARARAPGGGARRRARPDPRGRLDRRRRRGHADHDGAVPAAPEPQPGALAREIEARLRETLGVERVVWLGLGPRRGRRHRRPRRQHLRLDRARPACCCRPSPTRPTRTTRTAARTPSGSPRRASRSSSSTCCRASTTTARRRSSRTSNYYVANGALIVPVTGAETDADGAGAARAPLPGPRGGRRCQAPRSPSGAAGCTASPSRSRPSSGSGQLFGGGPVEDLVHARDLERALEAAMAGDERELRAGVLGPPAGGEQGPQAARVDELELAQVEDDACGGGRRTRGRGPPRVRGRSRDRAPRWVPRRTRRRAAPCAR